MKPKVYDYMLVGQGIAGTTLAWHLMEQGRRVVIINDTSRPSASRVAAGIYNPLTGRKLVKTWLADTLFPYAVQFYSRLEATLGVKLVYPVNIYRPYRSLEEKEKYLSYTADPEVAHYIKESTGAEPEEKVPGLVAPYGGLEVTGSGWIDVRTLLESSRHYFTEKDAYIERDFDSEEVVIESGRVVWREVQASKLILCQGTAAQQNRWFDWLPFNPVKGQILDVSFERYSADTIVNRGIFILPLPASDLYRVGATYSWHDLDWEITEDGRAYLERHLEPMLTDGYTIHRQRAGLRPSSKDRRPLLGRHPLHPEVGIFNGLGTKGVTLAPYFAGEFLHYLENGKELNSLVNIDRYFSLYYH